MFQVMVSFTKRNVLFTDQCYEADCGGWRAVSLGLSQTPAVCLINSLHGYTLKM